MRKTITLLLTLLLFNAGSFAQEFYIKATGGYAFALPGQTTDDLGNILNGTRITYATSSANSNLGSVYIPVSGTDYKLKTASFSAGIHGTLGGGYMIDKHIWIELDADINALPKKYTAVIDYIPMATNTPDVTFTRKTQGMVILLPSIVLQATRNYWRFYSRSGIALPFNSHIERQDNEYFANGSNYENDVFTWKIKNKFSLGFTSAVGVQYQLNDNVSLVAEASLLYLSLFRKEADLTAITSNGMAISISQYTGTHTIYYNNNGLSQPSGTPQQSFSQPFGNIGANIGIIIRPSHGSKSKEKSN